MDNFEEIEAAIRLSRSKGVGASMFKTLIDKYNKPSVALDKWNMAQHNYRNPFVSEKKNDTEISICNTLEAIRKGELLAFYYGHSSYPSQLNSLTEPPPVVYLSSIMKYKPFAAVVGSRKASCQMLELAEKYTLKLIEEGYGIVSGGAIGIDKKAHETALKANAFTVAVLANGLNVVYPKENKDLLVHIRESGVLMTELMIDAKPQRGFFPTRNRLIAALADKIVVIVTNKSKGSLITAKWALKLGKELILCQIDD